MSLARKLLAPSAGGGFSPADLFTGGEEGAYYEPDDLSTLFQNSNGTGAVTADGDPVAYLGDKSGNGYHATTTVTGERPLYKEDVSGYSYLLFDGTDDLLEISSLDLDTKTWDVLCAYKPSGNDFILANRAGDNNPWLGIGQNGNTNAVVPNNVTQNYYYVDNVLGTGTNRDNQFDDAQLGNVILFNASISAVFSPLGIGDYNNSGNFTVPGDVYFYFIREGTLTSDERADLTTYAAAKLGVTL